MAIFFKKQQKTECYFCKKQTKTTTYKYFKKELDICDHCLKNTKKLKSIVERFN